MDETDEEFSRKCVQLIDRMHDLIEEFDCSPQVVFTSLSTMIGAMILEEDDEEISMETFETIFHQLSEEDNEE